MACDASHPNEPYSGGDRAGLTPASLFSPMIHGAPEANLTVVKEQDWKKETITVRRWRQTDVGAVSSRPFVHLAWAVRAC